MTNETNLEAAKFGRTFFRLSKRLAHVLLFLWVLAIVVGWSIDRVVYGW